MKLEHLDRPIAYHRVFVKLTGSVTGAIMLSQAVYWQQRCSGDQGWWWKTAEDWEEETGMGRYELESARKSCSKFLQHKKAGVPCRSFYRVNSRALQQALDEAATLTLSPQTSMLDSSKLDCGKPANKNGGNQQTTSETTPETSSETVNTHPPSGSGVAVQFREGWCNAWKEKYGTDYPFSKADGVSSARLAKAASPEYLISMARWIWRFNVKRSDEFCKGKCSTIAGFESQYSRLVQIMDEVKQGIYNTKPAGGTIDIRA